jgi:hypothetical protein
MKSNASNFITHQQVAAIIRYKLQHVLQHLFFHLSWWQVAVLNCCVAIVCEIEACAGHSVCFKQRAIIEFLTAEGVSPIEIPC